MKVFLLFVEDEYGDNYIGVYPSQERAIEVAEAQFADRYRRPPLRVRRSPGPLVWRPSRNHAGVFGFSEYSSLTYRVVEEDVEIP